MAVNGGPTTICTPLAFLTAPRRSVTNAAASATVLNIFQLPAMKGVRMLFVRQGCHTREHAAAEELQRRAATGGDVSDLVGEAGFLDRGNRVAASDDRRASQ